MMELGWIFPYDAVGKGDSIVNVPLGCAGSATGLDIYVDQSSVEVFASDGSATATFLVYPTCIYDRLNAVGLEATVTKLERIW